MQGQAYNKALGTPRYAKDSTVYPQVDMLKYAITPISQPVKVLVMKYET